MTDFESMEKMICCAGFEYRADQGADHKLRKANPTITIFNLLTAEDLTICFNNNGSLFSFYYNDKSTVKQKGLFKGGNYEQDV